MWSLVCACNRPVFANKLSDIFGLFVAYEYAMRRCAETWLGYMRINVYVGQAVCRHSTAAPLWNSYYTLSSFIFFCCCHPSPAVRGNSQATSRAAETVDDEKSFCHLLPWHNGYSKGCVPLPPSLIANRRGSFACDMRHHESVFVTHTKHAQWCDCLCSNLPPFFSPKRSRSVLRPRAFRSCINAGARMTWRQLGLHCCTLHMGSLSNFAQHFDVVNEMAAARHECDAFVFWSGEMLHFSCFSPSISLYSLFLMLPRVSAFSPISVCISAAGWQVCHECPIPKMKHKKKMPASEKLSIPIRCWTTPKPKDGAAEESLALLMCAFFVGLCSCSL